MITKFPATKNTPCKTVCFLHQTQDKSPQKLLPTPHRLREGGRTVGSGRVATIIE